MTTKEAPAAAFVLSDGRIEIGDNGEGAKSHPFKMLARSSKAINHWFFGDVVHDFAGMTTPGGKERVVIDLNHDDNVQLGYANRFDVTEEGLWLSGALTPYKDGDEASRIAALAKAGVPYESSINFSGPTKLEEVKAGDTVQANGRHYTFENDGVVVREFMLRSCAVCPSGADPNTNTSLLSATSPMISYDLLTEDSDAMSDPKTNDAFEAAIKLSESPAPVAEIATPVAEAVVDADAITSDDVAVAVADESVEDQEAVAETATDDGSVDTPVEAQTLSRSDAEQLLRDFGPEAVAALVRGSSPDQVRSEFTISIRKERDELKAKLAKLQEAGQPATFSDPSVDKNTVDTLPVTIRK